MDDRKFCTTCGRVAKPVTVTKGSILVELVLWLMLIVPGLIYSIWRLSTRHDACAHCGSVQIVPLDSPVARKMYGELGIHPAPAAFPERRPGAQSAGYRTGRFFARLLRGRN